MKESYLSKKIQNALRKEFPGSFWFKVAGGNYMRAGVPDILGCVNGLFVGIEVKLPDRRNEQGAVSRLQSENIKEINNAGGLAFVAYSVEEAVVQVKEYVKERS